MSKSRRVDKFTVVVDDDATTAVYYATTPFDCWRSSQSAQYAVCIQQIPNSVVFPFHVNEPPREFNCNHIRCLCAVCCVCPFGIECKSIINWSNKNIVCLLLTPLSLNVISQTDSFRFDCVKEFLSRATRSFQYDANKCDDAATWRTGRPWTIATKMGKSVYRKRWGVFHRVSRFIVSITPIMSSVDIITIRMI